MRPLTWLLPAIVLAAFAYSSQTLAIGDFGPDTCAEGFVWREACGPSDHVCVSGATRDQVRQDNAQATARRQPGGGDFGPDTCRQGFVWREACGPGDHVCVSVETRSAATSDNARRGERLKYPICRAYAQAAVAANRQNQSRGCGFSGPRWQNDFNAHFQWCLSVGIDRPRAEAQARADQLAHCAPLTCAHCNDGSCQCGHAGPDQLCTGHSGNDPQIGCVQQP